MTNAGGDGVAQHLNRARFVFWRTKDAGAGKLHRAVADAADIIVAKTIAKGNLRHSNLLMKRNSVSVLAAA